MEEIFKNVTAGQKVILLWAALGDNADEMQAVVSHVQACVGAGGPKVCVENVERIEMAGYAASSFNHIFSGCLGVAGSVILSLDLLSSLLKLLAPGGSVAVVHPSSQAQPLKAAHDNLVLAGFSSVAEGPVLPSGFSILRASKPNFEVGAARLLSFAKPKALAPAPAPAPPAASVWTLEDMEDDSVELMDSDTLLDKEDLVKVDPATLRVCGTTGKRKACKDCSCGLSEELADGKEPTTKSVSSSCGSCYLGDAFRCGSCPYLGMPAFKPGEKIQLSQRQLNPDLKAVAV